MYKVVAGDTFEKVARKVYGSEASVDLLQTANPGVSDSLIAGTTLVVPVDPTALIGTRQEGPAANPDEIALKINGERFRFWETIDLHSSSPGKSFNDFEL